jgi:DNA polymerase-1
VATYLEETIKFAKQHKYVKTYFNRRRLLPDISSGDMQLNKRSERQAVNSVIQGTAADMVPLLVTIIY